MPHEVTNRKNRRNSTQGDSGDLQALKTLFGEVLRIEHTGQTDRIFFCRHCRHQGRVDHGVQKNEDPRKVK